MLINDEGLLAVYICTVWLNKGDGFVRPYFVTKANVTFHEWIHKEDADYFPECIDTGYVGMDISVWPRYSRRDSAFCIRTSRRYFNYYRFLFYRL